VDQHLLDLHGIHMDGWQIARHANVHLDPLAVQFCTTMGDGSIDELTDPGKPRVAAAETYEVPQPPHDLRHSVHLVDDPVDGFGGGCNARSAAGDACVIGHCGERLVDLVRQRSRELTHASEPEGTVESLLV